MSRVARTTRFSITASSGVMPLSVVLGDVSVALRAEMLVQRLLVPEHFALRLRAVIADPVARHSDAGVVVSAEHDLNQSDVNAVRFRVPVQHVLVELLLAGAKDQRNLADQREVKIMQKHLGAVAHEHDAVVLTERQSAVVVVVASDDPHLESIALTAQSLASSSLRRAMSRSEFSGSSSRRSTAMSWNFWDTLFSGSGR
jgi:PHD/YefM family antitoxin component YafN of YafNO toxin-antitoxin module